MSAWDRKTCRHCLIDTGADESVFPAFPTDRQCCSTTQPLAAGNDSRIATWVQRNISWLAFLHSILSHRRCTPTYSGRRLSRFQKPRGRPPRGRRLIDLFSYTIIPTTASLGSHKQGIHRVWTDDNDLASILNEFPELLVPRFHDSDENLHGVEHHLTITGPPVFARACRLHDEQLAVAKAEFKKMEDWALSGGQIRHGHLPYISHLNMAVAATMWRFQLPQCSHHRLPLSHWRFQWKFAGQSYFLQN